MEFYVAKVNKIMIKLSCLLITFTDVRNRTKIVFAAGSGNFLVVSCLTYEVFYVFQPRLSEIK